MPSFAPLLPAESLGQDRSSIHSSHVSTFNAVEHSIPSHIETTVNFGRNSANIKKSSPQVTASDSQQFHSDNIGYCLDIIQQVRSLRLSQQKGRQSNLLPGSHFVHWEESTMADTSPRTDETSTDVDTDDKNQRFEAGQSNLVLASDSSDRSKDKLDQKTLRRLAQNREAARKSRLRKKAYVQQLENSRLKLTQLEQELQRARQQGIFISSAGDNAHSMSGNGALAFDAEYARWLEEHNRHINELRAAVNSHVGDAELQAIVDRAKTHYDDIFRLKGVAAKADVFHILSGMWKTPAERCFLWLGGFRSSELLKVLDINAQ